MTSIKRVCSNLIEMLYLLSAGCQYVPDNNRLIDLKGVVGGGYALCLWPHSEPGASERLLSA